jgi:uncharacterized repeat protein (TIGR03803 family)
MNISASLRVISMALFLATLSPAQTFRTLLNFNGGNGAQPFYGSLIEGVDASLYGTTAGGGAYGYGSVFKITLGGELTTLYSFNGPQGYYPYTAVVQGADGSLYVTTEYGGVNYYGTIEKLTPAGERTTLHAFSGPDGAYPGGLIQARDGDLYGVTSGGGGSSNCLDGCGTVFKITCDGELTTLYSFSLTDGAGPFAALIQTGDGALYGTAPNGGSAACASGCGLLFKVVPNGTLTTLHEFDVADGAEPFGSLIQAADGDLYGTTIAGGSNSGGTVFKITTAGQLTTLYSFGPDDGYQPYGALVQATDGNFYGATNYGATYLDGTVFKVTPSGELTTLHIFDGADGRLPYAGLAQATDGNLYGTTAYGGDHLDGAIFRISLDFQPFVLAQPAAAKVGATVHIIGNDLTGATEVSFHELAAPFVLVSPTEISATVPVGATTGTVRVTTSSGPLSSNVPFRVIPTIQAFSPLDGPVGAVVTILGESFTGALGVAFGGVPATTFASVSNSQISATVPAGARTGKITVATPGGAALSADDFTVTAQ